jgi:hypothetical protein
MKEIQKVKKARKEKSRNMFVIGKLNHIATCLHRLWYSTQ